MLTFLALSMAFFGDCSRMIAIGSISPEKQRVIDVSLECLNRAIAVCRPGAFIWQIGEAIEDYLAKRLQCSQSICRPRCWPCFSRTSRNSHHYNRIDIENGPGMTFTIEPMINAGIREGVIDEIDHWTVRTKDGKPSAQWEHTLAITETGCEILTVF
jgi:methionyl aminopeptidase